MILRRQATLGGLLTIFSTFSEGCSSISGEESDARPGCILEASAANELLAKSSRQQLYATGSEPIVASSGDRLFDYALAQTLSKLTDTLGVLPGFAYYDGDNAFATDQVRMLRADGTILFGTRLLRETLREVEHPDVAVAAVCAHEFGHVVQFKHGLLRDLVRGQSNIKLYELHADFLAGYFAGIRKLEKPAYPAAVFATKLHAMGDSSVNSKDHHGLPTERARAVVRGFETAHRERRSLADAIDLGVQYVIGG